MSLALATCAVVEPDEAQFDRFAFEWSRVDLILVTFYSVIVYAVCPIGLDISRLHCSIGIDGGL